MSENTLQTFLENRQTTEIQKKSNLDQSIAIVDKSKEIIDLEKFQENPSSICRVKKFDDLRGFVEYINDFKTENTVVYAGKTSIEAIFDHSKKGSPKWHRHSASYEIKPSSRWAIWLRANNLWMNQREFADFLDTGLNEIVDPTQAQILTLVKGFRATVNHEIDSEQTPSGTSFKYSKVTKGGAKNEAIEIPEFLKIQLQPFENLAVINSRISKEDKKIPNYELRAKINWRIEELADDTQKIQFKIQILNVEKAVDETIEAIRGAMKELCDVTTYIG